MLNKSTKTLLDKKSRESVWRGVNAIYEPVRRTLGPEGRNALIYPKYGGPPRITNDGVTVSEVQEPKDPYVNIASKSFKEAAKKTNELVGDGTSGTIVIAGRLFNEFYARLSEEESDFVSSNTGGTMTLKRKVLESAEKVKESILKASKPVKTLKELEKIATISVEDPELGKVIAKMAWDVGVDGFIDTVEGYKNTIETEVMKGMRFPAKVGAKAFVTHPDRYEMMAQDARVLVTNYALDNAADFGKPFQEFAAKGVSKVIVIAPSFSNSVLESMYNAFKKGFQIYPVKCPSLRTEQFEDVATYCGAEFINKDTGRKLMNIKLEDLGALDKLIVKDTENREDAVATGGAGDKLGVQLDEDDAGFKEDEKEKKNVKTAIQERIEMLKGQLKETRQHQFKLLLQRRIASMGSAVGVIRVGGSTDAENLYKKLKVEDAVGACKAALRGGYVKGGGECLRAIAEKLDDDDILKPALMEPYEQIQSSMGGDFKISDDVIDATEAIYYAVEHAVGVVSNLITVDIVTPELDDPANGEGEFEIAKWLRELVISLKIEKGQLKQNQAEAYRDSMGGLTDDEFERLNG